MNPAFPRHLLLGLLLASACGPGIAGEDGADDPTNQTAQDLGGRAGVDYSGARPSPASLKAAGYTFASRYLSDSPSKNITRAEADALAAAGIDVVANWENDGRQEILDGFSAGVHAATVGAAQAKAAGMPGSRPIYFSVDFDAQPYQQGSVDAFMDGAASVIGRDRVGAYASVAVLGRLFDSGKIAWGWQSQSWAYGHSEPRAQFRQLLGVSACSGGCDVDVAVAVDFGQWRPGVTPVPLAKEYVAVLHAPNLNGYWLVAANGGVFTYGSAVFHGSLGALHLTAPVVGGAATPDGKGYWLVAADGGVFAFGSAAFFGSMGGHPLNAAVVAMAAAPDGKGYWLVAEDGGIFAFGSAKFHGSMGGHTLAASMVGIAATADGKGYWLVGADGGIFAFGDAAFYGSMGGKHLSAPIVGIAAANNGKGYWLVASDGGIFSFGSAPFYGSMGGTHLAAPIRGMASDSPGAGYWLLGDDGGLFALGGTPFYGSRAGK